MKNCSSECRSWLSDSYNCADKYEMMCAQFQFEQYNSMNVEMQKLN